MDHRWDEAARQERIHRHDLEVERRDRLAPARVQQPQSPWEIGLAHYDQRDLYTRNSRTDAAGYARGPSAHPAEGSYAYARPTTDRVAHTRSDTSPEEREAWPWLNYHDVGEDPFFSGLRHPPGLWSRLRQSAAELRARLGGEAPRGPKNGTRPDERILEDVSDILTFRGDIDATDITVAVKSGEVTLDGTVPDRTMKRLAEESAEHVRGVRDVHNRLTIRHDDPTDADVAFVVPVLG